MESKKFTQEVKDYWIKNLKSGKYIQGFYDLVKTEDKKIVHCCIGVLGDIMNNLTNDLCITSDMKTHSYNFLDETIGHENTTELIVLNDSKFRDIKPDYSNVIPFIEQLPVQS